MNINKPDKIVLEKNIFTYNKSINIEDAIKQIISGNNVLIEDYYSSGLQLLHALHSYLNKSNSGTSYKDQRKARTDFRKYSHQILVRICDQKLLIKKSPDIGWLQKMYADDKDFCLPFPQIQGLNSSWQWYKNGIDTRVLRKKIHPYYGVYFPTRFEHLILFDLWLKKYKGSHASCYDIGIGCGVLVLLLIKNNFQKCYGTDINPNAIKGMEDYLARENNNNKIDVRLGSLFATWENKVDLIVFNPPWLPASHESDYIDDAIFYPENIFQDFFQEAQNKLLPDGKIVLLFSNLGIITQETKVNPIEKELAEGNRFDLECCIKKPVKQASRKTVRNQHWRAQEEVELWVLKHKIR